MLFRLLILLTCVPLIELAILFEVAERITGQATFALVVLTGLVGAILARHQGLRTLGRIQADLDAGVMPARAVVDGVLILVAGALLITPGILTDLLGFCLLAPPFRALVRNRLMSRIKMTIVGRGSFVHEDDVFDAVVTEAEDAEDVGKGRTRPRTGAQA